MLQKWASDARFYALTAHAINLWHERTKRHKIERRRQAYIQIRAAIKVRLVRSCLNCMRERWSRLDALTKRARSRAERGHVAGGAAEIKAWRRITDHISDMNYTAASMDYQRLLGSSFAALFAQLENLAVLQSLVEEARGKADLNLLGRTLKRMQWVSFSAAQYAARRRESAEALVARTRAAHMKRIIRIWQAQSAASIARKTQQIKARGRQAEPESPSLRPANRAASRSTQPSEVRPPTAEDVHMPTYLRTPSRSRNIGRFRPVLLTPAPITPFDFDPAYLVTVPDPLHTGGAYVKDNTEQTYTPLQSISTSASAGQEALASQVTPFSRKLRAGGFSAARPSTTPASVPSALRNSMINPAIGGTGKSVRFSGAVVPNSRSRFRGRPDLKQQDTIE
nr:hypothetical protein CFP56_77451 [Quercus suber]